MKASLKHWPIFLFGLFGSSVSYASDFFVPCNRLGRWTDCIAAPLANSAQDAISKTFPPPASDKARVYIVRSRTIEPKTKTALILDGQSLAELVPMTYVVFEINPGVHHLNARTDHDFGITLDLKSGKTYYVTHRLTLLFFKVTGDLQLADVEEGQAEVLKSKLIEFPGATR